MVVVAVVAVVEVVEVVELLSGSSASVISIPRGGGARSVSSPESPGDPVSIGQSAGPRLSA